MLKFFPFALIIFFFQLGLAGTASAQETEFKMCSYAEKHVTLLKYAALAEIAYKAPGIHSLDLNEICSENNALPKDFPTENITVLNLSGEYIKDLAHMICPESNGECIAIVKDTNTDEEFIVCEPGASLPLRLSIAFEYIRDNNNLSLLTKVAIVSSQVLTGDEELRVVEFQQDDWGNRTFGIQGTDIFKIDQLNTSIQNLMGNSCIFNVAVEVAKRFFNSCENNSEADNYTIVGHSLGGAVAQHVAHNLGDFGSTMRECRNNVEFQAYSFNSFGIDDSIESMPHHREINSVRIAGEILEHIIGTDLNRRQLGHIFRYGMRLDQPSPNQSSFERFELHKISTVQEEICSCLSGVGEFEYTPPI